MGQHRISGIAARALTQGGGAGSGSNKILDNDDVTFKQLSSVANNEILVFDSDAGKFQSKDANTIIQYTTSGSTSEENYPLFIQNTAPVTTRDKYMWIQSEVNGDDDCFSVWFNDGL